jgi:hypothetical protein
MAESIAFSNPAAKQIISGQFIIHLPGPERFHEFAPSVSAA